MIDLHGYLWVIRNAELARPLAGGPVKPRTEREAAGAAIERQAAWAVIKHLGWERKTLDSPPERRRSPAVVAVLNDGRRVGIEVTEFCDKDYIERMEAAKKGKRSRPLPVIWKPEIIQANVRAALQEKDNKRHLFLSKPDSERHAWGHALDEYLVVVHTDESSFSTEPELAGIALRTTAPVSVSEITRAFFMIWYVSKRIGARPKIHDIPTWSRND